MVQNKDFKRLVRARMRKTGESYTAARASLSKQAPAPATRVPDLAALAGKSDNIIEARTGRTWKDWVRALDAHNAHALSHTELARLVNGEFGVPGWWAQTVAVGYERIKGKRALGQRMDGFYEASKSRTFAVPVSRIFAAFATAAKRRPWLDAPINVRTATPHRTMRLGMSDGTIVVLGFESKGKARSMVAVQHTKLPSKQARDAAKAFWAEKLDALAAHLAR